MGSRKRKGNGPHPSMLARLKPVIFTTTALLLSFVFLGAIELFLRLVGFGREYDLVFVKQLAGKKYYVLNRQVARRYFASTDIAIPDARSAVFEVKKSPNTVRIFCLGGSTTAGFPYTYNATFPSLLQDRLEAMFPDVNFEVVNVGISAINSYSVLDFIRELVRFEPDAFVIYMGHNEFYGALGVASSQSFGKNRAVKLLFLRLERLRLFRLVRWVVERARKALASERRTDITLMEAMAKNKAIPLGAPDYKRALSDFEANLQDILAVARRNGVPVLLSTLVSNLRDQPPFVSLVSPGLSPDRVESLKRFVRSADSLLNAGKARTALQAALQARAVDRSYAMSHFLAGKAWLALGRYDSALVSFERARDLDALRFRASSDFNRVILRVCHQFGVPFVRMDSAFAAHSRFGIPGRELFLEHLHPNFRGYFLMAREFAQALAKKGLLFPLSRWGKARTVSDSLLLERAGVTPLDKELGLIRIRRLTSHWPFNRAVELPESGADEVVQRLAQEVYSGRKGWNHAHYEAAQHYIALGEYDQAEREYKAVTKVVPTDFYPYLKLGDLRLARGDFSDADSLYRLALELSPGLPFAYAKLGTLELMRENPAGALKWLQTALERNRRRQRLKRSDLGRLHYALAVALAQTGSRESAIREAEKARRILPNDPAIRTLCRELGIGGVD